jgi:acyl-CoA dehydrogenase
MDLATIDLFLEDRHAELVLEVDAFAKHSIATLLHPKDDAAARLQARQILQLLGDSGWARYSVPRQEDGKETLDLRACCLIRETLAAASPLADAVFALQCLGAMPIALAGSEAARQRWLPGVAQGQVMAAFAMTEPEAGSDVGAIETRAERDGYDYVLNGHKILISNAGLADFYTVFAKTDLEAGTRGLSAFVVPAETEGLEFAGPQIMSEPHPLGELRFTDCRIPADSLLAKEGEGFKLGMRTLDRLRTTVAAAACGMASRALDEALRHAKNRQQFGRPLADFQLVQQKLARMGTDLTAARLLVYRAACEADLGAESVTLESAMAKAFATEAAQRIVDDAIQIIGGRGALADHPVDRLYRAVRSLRIYEGTTEVQYLVIAREMLRRKDPTDR